MDRSSNNVVMLNATIDDSVNVTAEADRTYVRYIPSEEFGDLIEEVTEQVEEKGRQVIESIPEDYTQLVAEVDGLQVEVAKKAELTKLYFDGSDIFLDEAHWEEYIPMTFDEVYALCHEKKNFVYIGDGQMKYYPQLDLDVPTKPESITFISTAQLDGKNNHTRIIINENNEVKTNQVIDTPWFDFVAEQKKVTKLQKDLAVAQKEIENLELASKGVLYNEETDSDALQTKVVPAKALPNASFDVIGGKSVPTINLLNPAWDFVDRSGYASAGITYTYDNSKTITFNGTKVEGTGALGLVYYRSFQVGLYTAFAFSVSGTLKSEDILFSSSAHGGKFDFEVTDSNGSRILTLQPSNGTVCNNEKVAVMVVKREYANKIHSFIPYTPNLISAPVDSVVSVGKNLFDEELELGTISAGVLVSSSTLYRTKNYIPVSADDTMCFSVNGVANRLVVSYYDKNKNFISYAPGMDDQQITSGVFKPISGTAFIKFRCYAADFELFKTGKVQLEVGTTPTPYSPYSKTTTPIPSAILALPDYGIGVSDSVYNWVDYTEKKYHHRVGSVDLGTLNWAYVDSYGGYFTAGVAGIKKISSMTESVPMLLSSGKYKVTNQQSWNGLKPCIAKLTVESVVLMADDDYTDAGSFKTAMQGVMLHYEKAEEEIIDLSAILFDGDNIIPVEGGGTVTMHLPDETYAVDMPNTVTYDVKVGA